jgi:hypothetical protein
MSGRLSGNTMTHDIRRDTKSFLMSLDVLCCMRVLRRCFFPPLLADTPLHDIETDDDDDDDGAMKRLIEKEWETLQRVSVCVLPQK